MNKNYFFVGLLALSAGIFAFQGNQKMETSRFSMSEIHFSAGGQSGLTGAPGEANCTQCHSGSVLNGNTENVLTVLNAQFQPVTSYTPGATYTVSLSMASSPTKKGFSATVLNPSNTAGGSLTGSGIGGTQNFSAGGRNYVSHTSTSNTDASALWAWTWTAPATNVGNVTFYVASNRADDSNSSSGDMIYLSQHVFGSVAGINDEEVESNPFTAGYSAEGNKVVMNFSSLTAGEMQFTLVDMNGKTVFTQSLSKAIIGANKQTVSLPQELKNGMYAVHMFVGNNSMTSKIMVQK